VSAGAHLCAVRSDVGMGEQRMAMRAQRDFAPTEQEQADINHENTQGAARCLRSQSGVCARYPGDRTPHLRTGSGP